MSFYIPPNYIPVLPSNVPKFYNIRQEYFWTSLGVEIVLFIAVGLIAMFGLVKAIKNINQLHLQGKTQLSSQNEKSYQNDENDQKEKQEDQQGEGQEEAQNQADKNVQNDGQFVYKFEPDQQEEDDVDYVQQQETVMPQISNQELQNQPIIKELYAMERMLLATFPFFGIALLFVVNFSANKIFIIIFCVYLLFSMVFNINRKFSKCYGSQLIPLVGAMGMLCYYLYVPQFFTEDSYITTG